MEETRIRRDTTNLRNLFSFLPLTKVHDMYPNDPDFVKQLTTAAKAEGKWAWAGKSVRACPFRLKMLPGSAWEVRLRSA
eukprot:15455713-Alexandrium_andersonii.AAC.1